MIKKHIPNTITCCNLVSGCIATVAALQGHFTMALLFIIIGAVFDFFDGMSARLLHVSSPIGKELDSLADDITFGVAPSAIVSAYISQFFFDSFPAIDLILKGESALGVLLIYLPFVMAAFSALRLAKFNLDERQAMGFIGLPTPANALFWGALVVGLNDKMPQLTQHTEYVYALLLMVFISCYLLVSEIPMFALKFKHWGWKGNEVKYLFALSCIPLLLFLGVIGIAAIILWYVLLSALASKK